MSGTFSYMNIKASSIAKDADEKRRDAREKAMLLFCFQLLLENGYADTVTTFSEECSLNLDQYTLCENIDLRSIFIDFEAYYHLRFQRYPQYFRKLSAGGESLLSKMKSSKNTKSKNTRNGRKVKPSLPELDGINEPHVSGSSVIMPAATQLPSLNPSEISGGPLCTNNEGKLLKPISNLEFATDEMRSFAETIQKEIVVENLNVEWNDVIGKNLDEAKSVLMETFQFSRELVNFFGSTVPSWKGLLLYGPPGTGKTLLAKAIASKCNATFFNVPSSTIVSKWRGDSEKMIKVLFDLARYHAPSIIFFDEFDALASNRDVTGESDASRRLKSEILQQIDGLLANQHTFDRHVFILGATNLPWEIDPAVIRRMEKRIYIPLPDMEERCELFKLYLSKMAKGIAEQSKGKNALVCQLNLETLAAETEGYSGSDLYQIIKESVIQKFREHYSPNLRKLPIFTNDVLDVVQKISCTVKPHQLEKFRAWTDSCK